MTETTLIVIVATYFIAGLIKGTLGIGFPTAAIALSAMVIDARSAIALVVIPMCLINAWQIVRNGHVVEVLQENWRLIVTMACAIGVFSLFSVGVSIRWLTLLLGVVMVSFSIISLLRSPPPLPKAYDNLAQMVTGTISGIIGGLAGIWAPPIIMYLSARRMSSAQFVQTVGVVLFIGSSVLLFGYIKNGLVNADNAFISTSLLIPTIVGFTVGEQLRKRIANELFQKLVLLFFLVLGFNFIRRAVYM